MVRENYNVVIVGAGIVGCAAAYYLSKSGLKVAICDKGSTADEASRAAGGMLAPLGDEESDLNHPLEKFYLASLKLYQGLDQELLEVSGIDVGLMKVPTLRPAFDEQSVMKLKLVQEKYHSSMSGLQWLDQTASRQIEPLLSEKIYGALLSTDEWNVQAPSVALAYAQGAVKYGATLFEHRPVEQIVVQDQRVCGVKTVQGDIYAERVLLSAGYCMSRWQTPSDQVTLFPVKGQMMELHSTAETYLKHTVYLPGMGTIIPKSNGRLYVGSTTEMHSTDKSVTVEGMKQLLVTVEQLVPSLKTAHIERVWAGLRPGSVDELPLIGPSQDVSGLWLAGGLYRDGILLGPLVAYTTAELMVGKPAPFNLDLRIFDPDRFGGWSGYVSKQK